MAKNKKAGKTAGKNVDKTIYNFDYGSFQASMKGYQGLVNRTRFKLFLCKVKPEKKDRILEIGCNYGMLLSYMSKFSDYCYGIDVNEAVVKKLKNRRIKVMSASKLAFKNNSFNKIYASHVIEHVPQIKKVFKEVHRVLKPGGIFVVLFPWELFRGMRALKETLFLSKNPFAHARKLHVHKLSPRKVRGIMKGIPFRVVKSRITFTLLPDYLMILKKAPKP